MDFVSVRFMFDSLDSAVEALVIVLEDARDTDKEYSFGSLSPQQILSSGLMIVGDASEVIDKLSKLDNIHMVVD